MPSCGFGCAVTLLGAPSLASDGQGNVVYVGLADTDGDLTTAERVVMITSADGGQHFDDGFFVNDDGGDSCDSGQQDLPNVTFDTTQSPPVFYVVWRHKGAGTYGGCMRHGTLTKSTSSDPSGCTSTHQTPQWRGANSGASVSISNMKQSCTGVGCMVGQGGLLVQAGDGAVTVMYSGSDSPPTSQCNVTGAGAASQLGWGTVTTYDGGQNWTTDPWIYLSNNYQWCEAGPSNNAVAMGLRDFGFVRAGNGHLYAAVHDTPNTIRLFESDSRGAAWREFCPANRGLSADGGPGDASDDPQSSVWMQAGSVCPSADLTTAADAGGLATNGLGNAAVMWPTLASDGDVDRRGLPAEVAQFKSRIVLVWSQTISSIDGGAFPPFSTVWQADTNPASPSSTNKFQSLLALSTNGQQEYGPQVFDAAGVSQNLYGQYMSIAVQTSNTPCFEDAGGDATTLMPDPSIVCHTARFWPFWMENPVGGTAPFIRTRVVIATN